VASLAADRPDCAILDVSLRGGTSAEVARELLRLDIPFLLHTGWTPSRDAPEEFKGAPWLEKPVTYDRLLQALAGLKRRARTLEPSRHRAPAPAPECCHAVR
jgi:DNA-binding NtrC family response regulator